MVLVFRDRRPWLGDDYKLLSSAFAVTPNLTLTNCHVVLGAGGFVLFKQEGEYPARLAFGNAEADCCIVRTGAPLFPVHHIRRHDRLKVGEKVYSVSSLNGTENTLGEGVLSGKRNRQNIEMLQTSAPISPGSSGGGLFDARGNLLGITTFLLRDAQNLNFAIPVQGYLEQIAAAGEGHNLPNEVQ